MTLAPFWRPTGVMTSRFTFVRIFAVAATSAVLATTISCASPTSPTSAESEDPLTYCSSEINRLRASIGRAPLARTDELEIFARRAAEWDGRKHLAHDYFRTTNGSGLAFAETEILWWRGYDARTVVQKGLAQMWAVGPGGEHYDILAGAYREVGCGVFINGPEITVVQDFR